MARRSSKLGRGSEARRKREALLLEIVRGLWLLRRDLLHRIVLLLRAALNERPNHLAALEEVGAKVRLLQVFATEEDGVVNAVVGAVELQS